MFDFIMDQINYFNAIWQPHFIKGISPRQNVGVTFKGPKLCLFLDLCFSSCKASELKTAYLTKKLILILIFCIAGKGHSPGSVGTDLNGPL